VKPGSRVRILFHIQDDYGFSRFYIKYQINDSKTKEIDLLPEKEITAIVKKADSKIFWSLNYLDLNPGQMVRYRFVLEDNKMPKHNVFESNEYELEVLTPFELEKYYAKLRAEILKRAIKIQEALVKIGKGAGQKKSNK